LTKDLLPDALRILQRRTIGVMEYARTVELPDGDFAGTKYDPSRHQAQECILRAIDAGAGWVAIMKPVQDGGSLASFVPILRRSHALGQTSIIAYPTMDSAKDAWTKKVWPMLERQGGTQPKKGGGSRGGAARVVNLPSGGSIILRAAGGRQESGQASVTADAMLVDEVDDWADLRVLRLIERRLSRSRDPLIVYLSTIKRDSDDGVERSRIARLYEQGTQTRLHYPCPGCSQFFPFEWELVRPDDATMACPFCGLVLTESDRVRMLPKWKRVDGSKSHKFSIMWTALESPLTMLVDGRKLPVIAALCEEYRHAKQVADNGDHGLLRQFFRDRLCRPYRADTEDRPDLVDSLLYDAAAQSTYGRGEIPAEAQAVVLACDVQLRRHYWLAVAYDATGQWWIVDWGRDAICGDMEQPTPEQRGEGLDRLDTLARGGWRTPAGVLSVAHAGIDTGFRPEEIRPWIAQRRSRWVAMRGAGTELARRMESAVRGRSIKRDEGWYDLREQDDAPDRRQIFIDADPGLDRISADWATKRGHLPRDLDQELVRHLTGMRPGDPGKGARWVPRGSRHDFLDCLIYALALARWKGVPAPVEPEPEPVASGGGGWVDSYQTSGGGSWL
jgi:phage terminase large subunit GpA-like protein